jgi:hypothetical protein
LALSVYFYLCSVITSRAGILVKIKDFFTTTLAARAGDISEITTKINDRGGQRIKNFFKDRKSQIRDSWAHSAIANSQFFYFCQSAYRKSANFYD